MIKILGVQLNKAACEEALCAAIPPQWLAAWEAAHPTLRREAARRASLAGLWLLAESGFVGTLSYTERGKPLPSTGAISVTHTEQLVFCAVSDGKAPIGLDAEEMDGHLDAKRRAAMAERWFSPAEQTLAAADEEAFYRVWTRKEAMVKRSGEGLCGVRALDSEAADCAFYERRVANTLLSLACSAGEEIVWRLDRIDEGASDLRTCPKD